MLKVLLLSLLLAAGSPPRASLNMTPRFLSLQEAYEKGIRATIVIEPDERNRAACLVWDSEFESGDHCWEYNELPSRRTTEIYIKVHHSGVYNFVLVLQGTDKRILTPSQEVEVQ